MQSLCEELRESYLKIVTSVNKLEFVSKKLNAVIGEEGKDDVRAAWHEAKLSAEEMLEELNHELSYRKAKGARKLKGEIEEVLRGCRNLDIQASLRPQPLVVTTATPAPPPLLVIPIPDPRPVIATEITVPEDWDPAQKIIIEGDGEGCLLVEAGPGTGKTAVACARVAQLVEEYDLSASNILLISFTRTAVKEVKDRIKAFASDSRSVAGLKIVTLDSFTWQVVKGLSDQDNVQLFKGYEDNIQNFIDMLENQDSDILEYLEKLEHVILDEGQDLVGVRAELCIKLIEALPEECGVTVFADSAQAIYGFTNDSGGSERHGVLTAADRIADGEVGGFISQVLSTVHRTNDPGLEALFTLGREELLGHRESDFQRWKNMKQLILDHAHGRIGDITTQNLNGRTDCLVLYRTRAEAVIASSFLWSSSVEHKMRMSGIPERVHPWIARLFGMYEGDMVGNSQFDELWDEKVGGGLKKEDAWKFLYSSAGTDSGEVKVVRLRELLTRTRPPIDFLVDEQELPGPVVGTIHASKGREANQVNLMLPPDEFLNWKGDPPDPKQIAEEERVLFVGATRARNKLMVGNGSTTYASRLNSGRVFKHVKKYKNARQVEVGLKSDIASKSLAGSARSVADIEGIQDWLWDNRLRVVELECKYDAQFQSNVLYRPSSEGGGVICSLSEEFKRDLFELADHVAGKNGGRAMNPGGDIRHIRMVGVTSVVIPEEDRQALQVPWRHSGFLLMPIITAFTYIFFNPRN